MAQGGGDAFPPKFVSLLVLWATPYLIVRQPKTNNTAPLRVPKINLVANCSPGGSLRDPPPLGPAAPRSPLGRGVGYPPRVTVGI